VGSFWNWLCGKLEPLNLAEFAWQEAEKIKKAIDNKDYAFLQGLSREQVNNPLGQCANSLVYAWRGGNRDAKTYQVLLELGADPNVLTLPYDLTRRPLITDIVLEGKYDIARLLIEHGADIEMCDESGEPLLHQVTACAAAYGDITPGTYEFFKYFLTRQPDVQAIDKNGYNLLDKAMGLGRMVLRVNSATLDVVKSLVDLGLDPTKVQSNGVTYLHFAAARGSVEMVRYFLEKGIDPNAKTQDGDAPLHWAVTGYYLSRAEVIECLLKAGADPQAKDSKGMTVLENVRRWLADPVIHDPRHGDFPLGEEEVGHLKEMARILENPPPVVKPFDPAVAAGVADALRGIHRARGLEGNAQAVGEPEPRASVGDLMKRLR
jgi:hypothetical protein